MPDTDRPRAGDVHAVLAALRRNDADALTQAYRVVFTGELGRLVLAHIAAEAGVGRRFGGGSSAVEIAYHQGGHDVGLEILERAGFDPASAVLMTMTGSLEGREDERSSYPAGHAAGADPADTSGRDAADEPGAFDPDF